MRILVCFCTTCGHQNLVHFSALLMGLEEQLQAITSGPRECCLLRSNAPNMCLTEKLQQGESARLQEDVVRLPEGAATAHSRQALARIGHCRGHLQPLHALGQPQPPARSAHPPDTPHTPLAVGQT